MSRKVASSIVNFEATSATCLYFSSYFLASDSTCNEAQYIGIQNLKICNKFVADHAKIPTVSNFHVRIKDHRTTFKKIDGLTVNIYHRGKDNPKISHDMEDKLTTNHFIEWYCLSHLQSEDQRIKFWGEKRKIETRFKHLDCQRLIWKTLPRRTFLTQKIMPTHSTIGKMTVTVNSVGFSHFLVFEYIHFYKRKKKSTSLPNKCNMVNKSAGHQHSLHRRTFQSTSKSSI